MQINHALLVCCVSWVTLSLLCCMTSFTVPPCQLGYSVCSGLIQSTVPLDSHCASCITLYRLCYAEQFYILHADVGCHRCRTLSVTFHFVSGVTRGQQCYIMSAVLLCVSGVTLSAMLHPVSSVVLSAVLLCQQCYTVSYVTLSVVLRCQPCYTVWVVLRCIIVVLHCQLCCTSSLV